MSEGARVNARHAGALIRSLLHGGVAHAVVSPGSRNTPIVLALHALRAQVDIHVALDERSAAFYALGLARVTGTPVILSCTSGSAAGHWMPAVIEASQSHIPLICITADRPIELQGHGAPQTIDQNQMFGNQVRMFADLGTPSRDLPPHWLASVAARAIDAATGTNPGPVHLNAPFRKPLWFDGVDSAGEAVSPARLLRGPPRLDEGQLDALADRLLSAPRGVIVCGPRELALSRVGWAIGPSAPVDPFGAAVTGLAERLGWPVLAEPASRARFGKHARGMVVAHADAILTDHRFAEHMAPDVLLRFGQDPTNKAVYQWAARYGRGRTDVVDPVGRWHDPHHVTDTVIAADPVWLCRALSDRIPERTASIEWFERWRLADRAAAGAIAHHCAEGLWEGAALRVVAENLPDDSLLHLASSMAVRTADTFCGHVDRSITVVSSRGANGIDGTLSTALGESAAWRHGPTVAVLGDLAFLHDVAALQLARQLKTSLTAVVIDNGGGAIFDRLPIHRHAEAFERYFLTPQQADLVALSTASGAGVAVCESMDALRAAMLEHVGRKGLSIVILRIDRDEDATRRRRALQAVVETLTAEFPEATGETATR